VLSGEALFPELLEEINDVRAILVTTREGAFTIERGETAWVVNEKTYPAAADQIQRVLVGVAQLRTVEAKTRNPELYSKLQLEDVSEPEAKSVWLQLRGPDEKTLASLIVGKQRHEFRQPLRQMPERCLVKGIQHFLACNPRTIRLVGAIQDLQ